MQPKPLKQKQVISSPIKKVPVIHEVIEEEPEFSSKEQIHKPEDFKDFNNKTEIKGSNDAEYKEYFVCDKQMINAKNLEHIEFSHICETETIFNMKFFIEFLLYQIIFFFFLGPFLSGFLFILNKNSALSRNQHFWGFSYMFVLQTLQYLITVTSFCLYYYYQPKAVYTVEIYMLILHLVIFFCIKATKFATINQNKMDFIKNKCLKRFEYASEFLIGMCVETNRFDIEKELQSTIIRKEIDIGLFGLRFITPMNEKYNDILREELKEPCLSVNSGKNTKLGEEAAKHCIFMSLKSLKNTKVGREAELLKEKVKECPGSVYSGFNLAGLLLDQNKKHMFSKARLNAISLFIGLTTALIPNIIRFKEFNTCFGETKVENYMIGSLFFGTLLFVFNNAFFLINAIFEYEQVYQYLSQLSNLISPRRLNYYYSKKYLPTLDFFEPFTFKSWGILHRVLRNYGKKQKTRTDYHLIIFLLTAILLIICLIMTVFDYFHTYSEINVAVFEYQTLYILIILLIILKKGFAINKLYSLHITLLKANKNILSDLLTLNEIYFQNDKFVPENEIYSQGVKVLKNMCEKLIDKRIFIHENTTLSLGEDKNILFIKKILKNLIQISNDLIEELQYTLENEPFNVLSIPATEDVMHSIWALIASGVVAILKKMIVE